MLSERISGDAKASHVWAEVAQSARVSWHILSSVPAPAAGSTFGCARYLYPFEPFDERARPSIGAALEQLTLLADIAAQLRSHPEHELARAARESAPQGVQMRDARDPRECSRRRLPLVGTIYKRGNAANLTLTTGARCKREGTI